jgi:hypothetical protein
MKQLMGRLLGVALAASLVIASVIESTPSVETFSAPALVYVTREHGKKYHAQECRGLAHARAADITSLSREDAEASGYVACHNCFAR